MLFYSGVGPDDAAEVIDASLGRSSESSRGYPMAPSHTRGHAVAPLGRRLLRSIDCVKNFSSDCMKSAFLSRGDQDRAAHAALASEAGQEAIRKLNAGSESEQVKWDIRPLKIEMANFRNGQQISRPIRAKYVTVVLRHPMDCRSIHVHTCFPMGWTGYIWLGYIELHGLDGSRTDSIVYQHEVNPDNHLRRGNTKQGQTAP